MPDRSAGEVTYAYLQALLDREEARRQSMATRAAVVLSTATGTGALLLATLSWTSDLGQDLSGCERFWIGLTVAAVLAAAGVCLFLLAPQPQDIPDLNDLTSYLTDAEFDETFEYALQPLAEVTMDELKGVASLNDRNAKLLVAGFTALAMATLAIFVTVILLL